jgi:hypothetical protein
MRSVQIERFGGPEVLEVAEISSPEPQGDEVVGEVEAASIRRICLPAPACTTAPGTHRWLCGSRPRCRLGTG